MLSVVLPVRVSGATAYLVPRLEANLRLFGRAGGVECVVVDSASERPYREAIRRACERHGAVYVADPAPLQPFAPGMTRNAGARRASGDALLFYDVDLCCHDDFVPRVQAWLETPRAPAAFLMIPCLYLTRAATERVAFDGGPIDLEPYRASLLRGDNDLVTHVAASTSTIVVSRAHFLALGGNRPAFRGHGAEDFDLLHRLVSYYPRGRRPGDYYDNVKERFPGDYRGFRDYWARYALPHLFDGLYTAHLWHPRPLHRVYFRARRNNEALLQRLMRSHDATAAKNGLPAPWQGERVEPDAALGDAIAELQERAGYPVAEFPGLFRWRDGVADDPGTVSRKLRKLLLSPKAFFADSRLGALRALARYLPD